MTWSVNHLAAQAVALYGSPLRHVGSDDPTATPDTDCLHCAEARQLMEMLGLVGPDGTIAADDTRLFSVDPLSETTTPVERSSITVQEPRGDRSLVPPGLRNLLPHAEQPKRVTTGKRRCGTITGATIHLRHGEEVCRACKDARNAYARNRRRLLAATAGGESRTDNCGTVAGRARHLRNGEKVCRECKDAYNTRRRDQRRTVALVDTDPEVRSA
jgi:hypothetical protein